MIDAHSKWIEVFPTKSSTSTVVIENLRTVFAQFGIPETIVSDNGPCFVSEEFSSFLKANGVKQITSAPYHPATNGLAERAVQIVKRGLFEPDWLECYWPIGLHLRAQLEYHQQNCY